MFPRSPLPMIPASPETRVDLIASDWAVPALAALFDSGYVPGRFYHICTGPNRLINSLGSVSFRRTYRPQRESAPTREIGHSTSSVRIALLFRAQPEHVISQSYPAGPAQDHQYSREPKRPAKIIVPAD